MDAQEETMDMPRMQQWHKGPRHETVSTKQERIQQNPKEGLI
jgi:hypothetical protein